MRTPFFRAIQYSAKYRKQKTNSTLFQHYKFRTILQAVQVMKRPSADPSAAIVSSLAQAGLAQGLGGGRSGTARGGTRKDAK